MFFSFLESSTGALLKCQQHLEDLLLFVALYINICRPLVLKVFLFAQKETAMLSKKLLFSLV